MQRIWFELIWSELIWFELIQWSLRNKTGGPLDIAFLCPAGRQDPFFGPLLELMEFASERLEVNFEAIECHRDPTRFYQEGLNLLERDRRPDYLILVNDMDKGVQLLPRATEAGVKVFGLLQGFHAADRLTLGRPTEDYPNWIGELLPDDRQAGKLLATELIEQAREKNLVSSDGSLRILGLSGPYTVASIARLNGLREIATANSQVIIEEVAPAGWDHARAREQTKSLTAYYPEASIIWAANDAMAFGAIDGLRDVGRKPGQEVLVGGIDWSPGVGTRLRNGDLAVSLGGHSFDGLWALALLKLHHGGLALPKRALSSRFVAMTRDNEAKYGALTEPDSWPRIDFPRLLSTLRDGGESAELSADSILDLLRD